MGRKWVRLKTNYITKRRKPSLIAQIKKLIKEPKRSTEKLQNAVIEISPAHALLDLMEELVSPPEKYIPVIEYNQKNDSTPLPVGNLQTFFRDLSNRAAIEWQNWTEGLDKPIEDLMLDKDEKLLKLRYKRIVSVEDGKWLKDQNERINRAITETTGFHKTEIPKVERFKYSPSYSDRATSLHLTNFETNVARVNSLNNQDHLIPNCGPRDDPDYMSSGDSSLPFNIIKPASRVFNAAFIVKRKDGIEDKIFPPKKGKDYSTEKDIIYLYKTKGIEVVDIKPYYPSDQFEIDLRVTRDSKPDPRNYKKLDPFSPIGLKVTQMLDEQAHLWEESSWLYTDILGNTEKKVAFSLTFPHDLGGFITYWVYMDNRYVNFSKNPFSRRKVQPHILYIEQRCSIWPDRPLYQKLVAELVYHKWFKRRAEELADQKLVSNYTKVKTSTDMFDVITDVFVRNDALSKSDRDKFLLSKANWQKKYPANMS